MKRLLLNRHAEAANFKETSDFDRPLTSAGLSQAKQLAENLDQAKLHPEIWYTSSAARAITTAAIVTGVLSIKNLREEQTIYEAAEGTLLTLINSIPDGYSFAAITGHNPGISYLFNSLCNEVRDVPPCTALLIEFEVDQWTYISAGTGTFKWTFIPH